MQHATLTAHHNDRIGWYVLTGHAEMWLPSEEARKAIEQSPNPASTVVLICEEQPSRGTWS